MPGAASPRPPAGRLLPRVGAEVRAAAAAGSAGRRPAGDRQPRGGGSAKAKEAGKETQPEKGRSLHGKRWKKC